MRVPSAKGTPVVVKVGSSSLTEKGGVNRAALRSVVGQVAALWERGNPAVLVSSGAVAAGLPVLGLDERPKDMPGLQVAAAVGQGRLMELYSSEFSSVGLVAGQVLLTKDVLANRSQYLHARRALERMLALGVVPVVNENDTVAIEELRLGDNDRLAAIVSHLVAASMLVILTDTAGLYSGDPRFEDDAELLSSVRHFDKVLDQLVMGGSGPLGSGGVATKVAAARMAAWSGIPTVIAGAGDSDVVLRAVAGDEVGTWVAPHTSKLAARKLWVAFGQPASGRLVVDEGAAGALVTGGKSLLAVGLTEVHGEFEQWDAVEVYGPARELIGKGLVMMDAAGVRLAMGKHSSEVGGEIIHRDDLVVLVAG